MLDKSGYFCYIIGYAGKYAYLLLVRKQTLWTKVQKEVLNMSNYEVMMVFSLKNGEEQANALLEKFKAMIEANGTLGEVDVWGKRRLAYLIDDEAEGFYALANFESNPEFPAELDRVFKITDGVLRTMIIKK